MVCAFPAVGKSECPAREDGGGGSGRQPRHEPLSSAPSPTRGGAAKKAKTRRPPSSISSHQRRPYVQDGVGAARTTILGGSAHRARPVGSVLPGGGAVSASQKSGAWRHASDRPGPVKRPKGSPMWIAGGERSRRVAHRACLGWELRVNVRTSLKPTSRAHGRPTHIEHVLNLTSLYEVTFQTVQLRNWRSGALRAVGVRALV